jgi:flagellar hook-length control protein FliK
MVGPDAQVSSAPQDAALGASRTCEGEGQVPLNDPDDQPGITPAPVVPGSDQQAHVCEVNDGGKDEARLHEGERREDEAPHASDPEEQIVAVATASAAPPAEDRTQPSTASDKSAPFGPVDAIGTKGAPGLHEPARVRGPEESRVEAVPTEAAKEAFGELPVKEAGTEARPATKPDQPLPNLQSVSSGAAARIALENAAQAANAPIRVVSEVPLAAVPIEIGLKSLAGINQFEIRLDPVELGRIEVRLEIDQEGGVKAHLSVDRVETLALLQRDAKTLERAFDQAGLKLSDGSIDLSLRDQQAQGQGRHEHAGDQRRDGARHPGSDISRDDVDPARAEAPRRLWRGGAGIDVRI